MAAIYRLACLGRVNPIIRRHVLTPRTIRCISTSTKSKDTITSEAVLHKPSITAQSEEASVTTKKNWVSYGFDFEDEATDRFVMHVVFFVSVTFCLVFGSFVLAYQPDYRLKDWTQREAFLELHRREKLGLPPIDKNYVDPAKIELPSDAELGDTEIIV